jgi:ATP phosphoribosyltransferase
MFDSIIRLFADAEIKIDSFERSYRPRCSDPQLEIKILRAQNIPPLVALGAHDVGFTGFDWIRETGAQVDEVLDTGLDTVRLVAAVPQAKVESFRGREGRWIVASEYESITHQYLRKNGLEYVYVRSFGSTEVFPPEDADMIIDNCATGITLEQNELKIVDELFTSSTRIVVNRGLCAWKKKKVQDMRTLFESVLTARKRVLLEMNVGPDRLDTIVKALPAMKSPTIQKLYADQGYAVKAAVPRADLPVLIPRLKELGATDILQTELKKVVL